MKIRLLDILACPEDKTWPLKVHIFEERELEEVKIPQADELTKVVCRYYCGKKGIILLDEEKQQPTSEAKNVDYQKDCKECLTKEIISGVIECHSCNIYYPIIDEIPVMLKVELRNEDIERDFTTKWAEKIQGIFSNRS